MSEEKKLRRKELVSQYRARTQTGGVFSITCLPTGKRIIKKALDLQGSRNHFEFAKMTGSCVDPNFTAEWKEFGPEAFCFEVLEQLEKKETQTDKEFAEDIAALEEICRSNLK